MQLNILSGIGIQPIYLHNRKIMSNELFSVGIDSGSRNTKITLIDVKYRKIHFHQIYQSKDVVDNKLDDLYCDLLKRLEINENQILNVFSTGYGRKTVNVAKKNISEIVCHARGCSFFHPGKKTIIDVGGQDAKIVVLNGDEKIVDFVMNDKCAAGTGRFVERAFEILNIDLKQQLCLVLDKSKHIEINNTCAVFAESEIISFLNQQVNKEVILQAVFVAIAKKLRGMSSQLPLLEPIILTGGLGNFKIFREVIELIFKKKVMVSPLHFFTGAIGAAIAAMKSCEDGIN